MIAKRIRRMQRVYAGIEVRIRNDGRISQQLTLILNCAERRHGGWRRLQRLLGPQA